MHAMIAIGQYDEGETQSTISAVAVTPALPVWERMKRTAFVAAMVLLGAFDTGCVAWYEGTARKIDPFPTVAMQKAPRRTLSLEIHYHLPGRADLSLPEEKRQYRQSLLTEMANEVLDESKGFERSLVGSYRLKVSIVNSGNPHFGLATLAGLTLLIVPTVATDVFDVEATLQDAFGRSMAIRRLRQEKTALIELLMVFGMPFASPWQTGHRMWTQVFQDLLAFCEEEIDRYEGLRPPASPSVPQRISALPPQ